MGALSGRRLAALLWILLAVVVSVAVALKPSSRTVTPVYREAAANFESGRGLYAEGRRFHYLPAFAIAYAPVARVPFPWAEVPWRLAGLALLVAGVSSLAGLASAGSAEGLFPIVTFLTIPASLSSARSGQTNLWLAGVLALVAAAVARRQDTRVAAWIFAGVILKPIAIVLAGLAAILRGGLLWRVVVALLAAILLPFAFAERAWVVDQYRAALQSWSGWSTTAEHRFCDLAGLLRAFHAEPPGAVMLAVRAAAALATILLVWRGRKATAAEGAMQLLGFSTAYLMLFNPMTETNSYVLLSPIVAAYAGRLLFVEKRKHQGLLLIAIAVGLGVDSYGNPIHPWTDLWLKALLAAVFYAWLVRRVTQPEPALQTS